ncbi:MAG: DUF1697 domain-containing protein [Planctomycetota bacterium]
MLHVAFLRGMNLGKRRIKNPELCAAFAAIGCEDVAAFLASGNVVFRAQGKGAALAQRIAEGLEAQLGYPVPTFLRSAKEVRALAAAAPFEEPATPRGKLQVAFLAEPASAAAKRVVRNLQSDADWLTVDGRELYWWPQGGLSQSTLNLEALERALGAFTIRTHATVQRLTAKYLAD